MNKSKICIFNDNVFNKVRGKVRDFICVSCFGVRGGLGGCIFSVSYKVS